MKEPGKKDPFIHAVMRRLSPEIRASFTPAQRAAIEEALMSDKTSKVRRVDIRLNVPLFFGSYYLVFLMGRDRRVSTQRLESRRQQGLSISSLVLFFFILLSPLVVVILLILYAVKTALGVDLMPDWHLRDLLRFW
jgi:hypothetical protein